MGDEGYGEERIAEKVTVMLPPSLARALERYAQRVRRSKSNAIRYVLERALRRERRAAPRPGA